MQATANPLPLPSFSALLSFSFLLALLFLTPELFPSVLNLSWPVSSSKFETGWATKQKTVFHTKKQRESDIALYSLSLLSVPRMGIFSFAFVFPTYDVVSEALLQAPVEPLFYRQPVCRTGPLCPAS